MNQNLIENHDYNTLVFLKKFSYKEQTTKDHFLNLNEAASVKEGNITLTEQEEEEKDRSLDEVEEKLKFKNIEIELQNNSCRQCKNVLFYLTRLYKIKVLDESLRSNKRVNSKNSLKYKFRKGIKEIKCECKEKLLNLYIKISKIKSIVYNRNKITEYNEDETIEIEVVNGNGDWEKEYEKTKRSNNSVSKKNNKSNLDKDKKDENLSENLKNTYKVSVKDFDKKAEEHIKKVEEKAKLEELKVEQEIKTKKRKKAKKTVSFFRCRNRAYKETCITN